MTRDAFHAFLVDPATGPKLDAALAEDRRAQAPESHRCGRCGALAAYTDRAFSGAVLYTCYACGDGKGHPTFVQFGAFNHLLRRVGDR